jgi:hypothetical protein
LPVQKRKNDLEVLLRQVLPRQAGRQGSQSKNREEKKKKKKLKNGGKNKDGSRVAPPCRPSDTRSVYNSNVKETFFRPPGSILSSLFLFHFFPHQAVFFKTQ